MNTQSTKKRDHKRFESKDRISLKFQYAIESSLDISPLSPKKKEGKRAFSKYSAQAKNVSAEGICFHSRKKLDKGKILDLKLFFPDSDKFVHMQGQVRWSAVSSNEKGAQGYDTGVLLTTIEERPVHGSVHFDEGYHLYWSDVLEAIMEGFKKNQKKRI